MTRKLAVLASMIVGAGALVTVVPAPPVTAHAAPPRLVAVDEAAAAIAPEVRHRMSTADPDTQIPVVVVLADQAGLTYVPGNTRRRQLRQAIDRLRSTADATQDGLLRVLDTESRRGNASQVVPLWIENAVAVHATPAVVRAVARRPEVASVALDQTISAPDAAVTAAPAEPNLGVVDAPAMWDRGYRGQGVVVASMDTGVDITHPELAARWRGGSNSWYDPNGQHPTSPVDVNGHGTQTLGVIVGGDAGGTAVGVAPEARWIAVKIFDDRGRSTSTAIHLGFQWLLDPDHDPATPDAPNVVNNSWTLSNGGCVLDFQQDLRNLRAVGILPVFAAGNSGPNPGTVPSPANYPEALSVGGTTNADALDPLSSRGPSPCAGATAPTMTAPDTNIRTTGRYGSYVNASGTSIAAPHVTGAAALLLSASPGLAGSADTVQAALQQGAHDLGVPGVDNDTGYGRLDALAAYQAVATVEDYGLGVSPASVAAPAGGAAGYDVTVTPVGSFAGDVTLTASGLPTGVAASFEPATIAGGSGASRLTLSVDGSVPPGSYAFSVDSSSGALSHAAGATLVVQPPPDFGLAVAPSSRTVTAGGQTSYAVDVTPTSGFGSDVALSVTGLPAAVGSASFTPAALPGSGSSTLTVSTLPSAAPGTYPLTVVATSGSLTHSVGATLVVQAAPDFALSAAPSSRTVTAGGATSYAITVTASNGFAGDVALGASGLPASVGTATLAPTVLAGGGSSTLTVTTSSSAPAGTYPLTVTGAAGGETRTVTVSLVVLKSDFGLSASPMSATVARGQPAVFTISVTATGGFTGQVSLSVSGVPSGARTSWSTTRVRPPGTSRLTITPRSTTPRGTYTLLVSGSGAGLQHAIPLTLTVV